MSKKSFYHNERRRHQLAPPKRDSRSAANCASMSCDVDARISCGGKTFQSKLIGNDEKDRYSKNVMAYKFTLDYNYFDK